MPIGGVGGRVACRAHHVAERLAGERLPWERRRGRSSSWTAAAKEVTGEAVGEALGEAECEEAGETEMEEGAHSSMWRRSSSFLRESEAG